MRRCLTFLFLGLAAAGCQGLYPTPHRPERVPEEYWAQQAAKPASQPALANREAMARALPLGVNLSLVVHPPGGGTPFAVERRLAELGAQCRDDGVLVGFGGKVIYQRLPQ